MEQEKTIKLNRIDILNIKGCLLSELHDQQNQLELWQQQIHNLHQNNSIYGYLLQINQLRG